MSVILGIDAGFAAPGLAVVDCPEDKLSGSKVIRYECYTPVVVETTRRSDSDVSRLEQLATHILQVCSEAAPAVIVAELPTGGAKNGDAMRGMAFATAVTVASLTAYCQRAPATKVVYISPLDNKKGVTGYKTWNVPTEQGKWEVMAAVRALYPDIEWPTKKKKKAATFTEFDDGKCWAIADAISTVVTYLRKLELQRGDSR